MDATAIREALEDWVESTSIDRAGVPPDAKLNLDWAGGMRGHLIGPIPPGVAEPIGGIRTRLIDLRLEFGARTPRREVDVVLRRLRASLEADPRLGGRLGDDGGVQLRELAVEDTDDGNWLATLSVAHTALE